MFRGAGDRGLNPSARFAWGSIQLIDRRHQKIREEQVPLSFFGAGDRGRTDTVSLPLDFESSTSANSITPAYYYNNDYYITKNRFRQALF